MSLALAVLGSLPAFAAKTIPYSVPLDWIRVESQWKNVDTYQTSFDPSRQVFVMIRSIDTASQTSETWVMDEVKYLERSEGIHIHGKPYEKDFGGVLWVTIDWDNSATSEIGRKYYLENAGERGLVEVTVTSRHTEEDPATVDAIAKFLASFKV